MNWKLTPEKKNEFLEALAQSCNVSKACEEVGISRVAAYGEREKDPRFALDWQKSIEIGIGALEDEAHRRAFDGSLVATKSGMFKQYSDTLAIFLLKAHRPDRYMERTRSELTGPGGEPLNQTDAMVAAKLAAIMQAAMQRKAEAESAPQEVDDDDDYSDFV